MMSPPLLTRASSLLGLAGLLLAAGMTFGVRAAVQGPAAEAPHKPQRVVSINLCVDELVLRLADRGNVASISWLARDPDNSNVTELARDVPINHGLAEEIIPLNPDLVIGGIYTARAAVAVLKRTGVPTVEVGVPRTFAEVRQQYRDVAASLGEPVRGERLVAEMDAGLAKFPIDQPGARPRAMLLNPNGYTIGRGSLFDEIITRAGLENAAATLGLGEYGSVPLEVVAMTPVDVLIVSANRDGPPAMATEMLRHPVLTKHPGNTRVVMLPSRLWNCSGPELVQAVEVLARAAKDVRGEAGRE